MLGEVIKKIRKKRGYSQTAFAKMINVTQPSLSLIEKGKLNPSKPRLKLIASELEVTSSVLYMMALERDEIADDKKELYDILMPTIKELLLSLI